MTSTQRELIAARKARLARFAKAGNPDFDHEIRLRAPAPPPVVVVPARRVITTATAPKLPPAPRITLSNYDPRRVPLQILTIQGVVCEKFGIPRWVMTGTGRTRPIVRPRQIAMYLVREFLPSHSLPAIGRKFGGRDHTTTLHGIRTIGAMVKLDPAFALLVDGLRQEIRRVTA